MNSIENKTHACSTIRPNHKGFPEEVVITISSQREMNRGEYLWHCNDQLVAMGWFDKHPVYLESTTTPPPTPFTRCAHNHSKKGRTWAKTASSMPILICYVMILFSSLVFISFLSRHWVIPENIHTYTMDCFYDFGKGGGVHDYGILRARGVFTIGNPKAWGNSTGGISGVESVE